MARHLAGICCPCILQRWHDSACGTLSRSMTITRPSSSSSRISEWFAACHRAPSSFPRFQIWVSGKPLGDCLAPATTVQPATGPTPGFSTPLVSSWFSYSWTLSTSVEFHPTEMLSMHGIVPSGPLQHHSTSGGFRWYRNLKRPKSHTSSFLSSTDRMHTGTAFGLPFMSDHDWSRLGIIFGVQKCSKHDSNMSKHCPFSLIAHLVHVAAHGSSSAKLLHMAFSVYKTNSGPLSWQFQDVCHSSTMARHLAGICCPCILQRWHDSACGTLSRSMTITRPSSSSSRISEWFAACHRAPSSFPRFQIWVSGKPLGDCLAPATTVQPATGPTPGFSTPLVSSWFSYSWTLSTSVEFHPTEMLSRHGIVPSGPLQHHCTSGGFRWIRNLKRPKSHTSSFLSSTDRMHTGTAFGLPFMSDHDWWCLGIIFGVQICSKHDSNMSKHCPFSLIAHLVHVAAHGSSSAKLLHMAFSVYKTNSGPLSWQFQDVCHSSTMARHLAGICCPCILQRWHDSACGTLSRSMTITRPSSSSSRISEWFAACHMETVWFKHMVSLQVFLRVS